MCVYVYYIYIFFFIFFPIDWEPISYLLKPIAVTVGD